MTARKYVGRYRPEHWAFVERAVACTDDACLIWPFKRTPDGYAQLIQGSLCRLICTRAKGPPPFSRAEAAHSCGNGHLACVNGSHLAWKSHAENGKDLARDGRLKGERHGMAKFTEADVRRIRASPLSNTELALQFGVEQPAISRVRSRQRWAHVD